MFDPLAQFGLPAIAEAHGQKWVCLSRIFLGKIDEDHAYFVAVPANEIAAKGLPLALSMIAVPNPSPQGTSPQGASPQGGSEGSPADPVEDASRSVSRGTPT